MKYLFFFAVIVWFAMYPPTVSLAENSLVAKQRQINLEVKKSEIRYLHVKSSVLEFQIKQSIDSVKTALKKLK